MGPKPRRTNKTNSSSNLISTTPTASKSPCPTPTKNTKNCEELTQMVLKLTSRVAELEGKLCRLDSQLSIASTVNDVLRGQLDDLQQYSRRSCLIIDGIKPTAKESTTELKLKVRKLLTRELPDDIDDESPISNEKFESEFDKCHRLGPIKDGSQAVIIKFKSHGFKERVYAKRKAITNKTTNKIRVSLTQQRSKLLAKAHGMCESIPRIKFAYADVNGGLRLLLNKPFKRRWTIPFTSEYDLEMKLAELCDENNDGFRDDNFQYDSDFA